MDKDNVFCSSKFHLDANDVVHIFIRDLVGAVPNIVLYNDAGLEEDTYPPPIVYTAINYGYLYNYYAANYISNIAPIGWHLPTRTEFETLVAYVGGTDIAGGKLKETGVVHWLTPNTGATNDYGFNARGGGQRHYSTGLFSFFQTFSFLWSATIGGGNVGYCMYTANYIQKMYVGTSHRGFGFSVRLIKDDSTDIGYMTGNDGKIYHTVKIGDQVWLAENLAETKYRNGDSIAYVSTSAAWIFATNNSVQAMCAYDNNISNV